MTPATLKKVVEALEAAEICLISGNEILNCMVTETVNEALAALREEMGGG